MIKYSENQSVHCLHKITIELCYKIQKALQCLTQQSSGYFKIRSGAGSPGQPTSYVSDLGFRRPTCFQPQECAAALTRTLQLNLFLLLHLLCFARGGFHNHRLRPQEGDEEWSRCYVMETPLAKPEHSKWKGPLTLGACGLWLRLSDANRQV